MLGAPLKVDALDDLAKSSLSQVLNNFVLDVFRRNYYLVLFQNVLTAAAEVNFYVCISRVPLAVLAVPPESLFEQLIILLDDVVVLAQATIII